MIGKHANEAELETRLCVMLDYIASRPKLEPACRAAGYNSKYIWTLLKRSGAGDPRYLVRWPDVDSTDDKIQFADAVNLALRMHKAKLATTLQQEIEEGHAVVQINRSTGDVIWEKDPELLARFGDDADPEEISRLWGIDDYPYKHRVNAKGNLERIPLKLFTPSPAALRQHGARSLLPGWNPAEHRTTTNSHSGEVVMVMGPKPYDRNYKPNTPLAHDLQARLADLRKRQAEGKSRLPVDANGRPTMPAINGTARADDPPEGVGHDRPAAPQRMSGGERIGYGRDAGPGGFSLTTGKPT
jgi:hypothetical protein